jgi:Holliday junction resolvase RusA-like endonuclease
MNALVIDVVASPKAQPRARAMAFRRGKGAAQRWSARVYDPGTAGAWRAAVSQVAGIALGENRVAGPVVFAAVWRFDRPKSHYRVRRGERVLISKPENRFPTSRNLGDVDNLAKSTTDVLVSDGFMDDDAFCVAIPALKVWARDGDHAGARIAVVPAAWPAAIDVAMQKVGYSLAFARAFEEVPEDAEEADARSRLVLHS